MKGDIREIAFARELFETGTGSEVDGFSIRCWVDDGEGDQVLGLVISGPRDGVDGDLSRLLKEDPVDSWIELLMGNR